MKDNRVIHRLGARELTGKELDQVTGGLRTLTICTITTERIFGSDEAPNPESC